MTRPAKPANYDALEVADQVAHHIAVIRWNEAHPEFVKAEHEAEHEKEKAAERAKWEAQLAKLAADTEVGRQMAEPPVKPTRPRYPDEAQTFDADGSLIIEDELEFGTPEYEAHHAEWDAYGRARYQYDLAHGSGENTYEIADIRKRIAQEEANAKWLADLGDSEPPEYDWKGESAVSYQVWNDAHDAWQKAHPDIVAARKAEYDAERAKDQAEWKADNAKWKAANPKKIAAIIKAVGIEKLTTAIEVEHVTVAAIMRMIDETDADDLEKTGVKEYADDIFDQIMGDHLMAAREAKRLKRDAKDPAAALERARIAAQREEMNDDKDEAKAEARQNGEAWGDISEEWVDDWIENNWTPEAEADFIVGFEKHWLRDHGAPFAAEPMAEAEPAKPAKADRAARIEELSDIESAAKIGDAVKAHDAADATRKEKAIIVGQLLVEAKKRHPGQKAFEKFLETVPNGFGIRRAETFMAFALGRKDYAQHQIENADAQQRHRDKLKAEKIEREKAKLALPKPDPKPEPKEPSPEREALTRPAEPKPDADLRNARTKKEISTASLREFEAACESCLPLMNKADLNKACDLFMGITNQIRKRKVAA